MEEREEVAAMRDGHSGALIVPVLPGPESSCYSFCPGVGAASSLRACLLLHHSFL